MPYPLPRNGDYTVIMQFIDTGVNLMGPAFDRDREAALNAAKDAGVSPLVITGSSIESSAGALDFAAAHSGDCWATAGVHPHNAKTWDGLSLRRLRELAGRQFCAAVGECGLDYNRNFSPPGAQRKCFEDQLTLAAELGKPVFLHERDAFEDFYFILKQFRRDLSGAVVHCFTGTQRELEAYLGLDCHIGITGWICDERRGTHLLPLLSLVPAGRLMLETDAPYLLPRNLPREGTGAAAGSRSGRNEPRFLPHIAACAAAALDKTLEQVALETFAAAAGFFGIKCGVSSSDV
ncbi:MAG: TatD family hydrolase [Treponema sp.]|jgi:TatD DNase family protein|nr:TatD family hydrolase [Treponema sp.]